MERYTIRDAVRANRPVETDDLDRLMRSVAAAIVTTNRVAHAVAKAVASGTPSPLATPDDTRPPAAALSFRRGRKT